MGQTQLVEYICHYHSDHKMIFLKNSECSCSYVFCCFGNELGFNKSELNCRMKWLSHYSTFDSSLQSFSLDVYFLSESKHEKPKFHLNFSQVGTTLCLVGIKVHTKPHRFFGAQRAQANLPSLVCCHKNLSAHYIS